MCADPASSVPLSLNLHSEIIILIVGFGMVTVLRNASIDLLGIGLGHVGRVEVEEVESVWWTFESVRDALVEAADLWRRSPGGVGAAWATDGPWRQMLREESKGDYDARGGDGTSSDVPLRPRPLTAAEVTKRDRISEWLLLVERAEDRRLVILAVAQLARGRARVSWRKLKQQTGVPFGEDGLRRRFERAIGAIAVALNTAENRR